MASVAAQIRHLDEVGATEFSGAPFGSREEIARTRTLLADLAANNAV